MNFIFSAFEEEDEFSNWIEIVTCLIHGDEMWISIGSDRSAVFFILGNVPADQCQDYCGKNVSPKLNNQQNEEELLGTY